jgi:hypothetical protein
MFNPNRFLNIVAYQRIRRNGHEATHRKGDERRPQSQQLRLHFGVIYGEPLGLFGDGQRRGISDRCRLLVGVRIFICSTVPPELYNVVIVGQSLLTVRMPTPPGGVNGRIQG